MLIVDETGDPKRGQRIVLAAQQYLGKLGHVANGVVAVTSHWSDGSRHVPVGVRPYRPASRLANGRSDPAFHTKPQLAWELIQEAQAAQVPFRLVVADSVYGESSDLEATLWVAHIPSIMGLRPSHGTWQQVEDPAHPPAFTPAEAAQRLPRAACPVPPAPCRLPRAACPVPPGNAPCATTAMAPSSCATSPNSPWDRATDPKRASA